MSSSCEEDRRTIYMRIAMICLHSYTQKGKVYITLKAFPCSLGQCVTYCVIYLLVSIYVVPFLCIFSGSVADIHLDVGLLGECSGKSNYYITGRIVCLVWALFVIATFSPYDTTG